METIETIVQNMVQRWEDASRKKDPETILSMIAEDAVFLSPGMGKVEGKEGVAALYRSMLLKFDWVQNFEIEEVAASGDMLYVRGIDSATVTPLDGTKPSRYRGYGMMILRKQPDGSWKFARGINSMSAVTTD